MVAAQFTRPESNPSFASEALSHLPLSSRPAWRSNGGPQRGHPARALPFSLEARLPLEEPLRRVHLIGVFALYAQAPYESVGTLGASIQLLKGTEVVFRQELLNGRHYRDATELQPAERILGDGTSVEMVGLTELDGQTCRVDLISIDVPQGIKANSFWFKDLGGASSFALFDVIFEPSDTPSCPFGARSGGVPLSEIGSILRMHDHVRFQKVVAQCEQAVLTTNDLEEAKGLSLTFLAIVVAAMLEEGGSRQLHLAQLQAAREIDQLRTSEEVVEAIQVWIHNVASPLFKESNGPSGYLVDRALALVERNFAKNLTDATVATQLGLSTSHFRYLFREATGQPFHKYLIALRLEKARRLLVDQEMTVSTVARSVGFAGLSHFSRAFTQRFGVSPKGVRKTSD